MSSKLFQLLTSECLLSSCLIGMSVCCWPKSLSFMAAAARLLSWSMCKAASLRRGSCSASSSASCSRCRCLSTSISSLRLRLLRWIRAWYSHSSPRDEHRAHGVCPSHFDRPFRHGSQASRVQTRGFRFVEGEDIAAWAITSCLVKARVRKRERGRRNGDINSIIDAMAEDGFWTFGTLRHEVRRMSASTCACEGTVKDAGRLRASKTMLEVAQQ